MLRDRKETDYKIEKKITTKESGKAEEIRLGRLPLPPGELFFNFIR